MLTVDELNRTLIELSFAEDVGEGDHTTLCCIPEDAMGRSQLIIKEDGILAGVRAAREVFSYFDDTLQMDVLINDGAEVKKGDVAFVVTGKIQSLLQNLSTMPVLTLSDSEGKASIKILSAQSTRLTASSIQRAYCVKVLKKLVSPSPLPLK